MLRNTFGQVVEMVRDECGTSSNSSRGNDQLAYIQRLIKRHYESLCDAHDWGFLHVENDDATKELQAGQRFYDFPVAMDMRNTIDADTFYGNVWVPLVFGIDMQDYTAMNPELNQRADPQIKWRFYNERQFEVWPMPASNGNKVRFKGKRLPETLTNNNSRVDMDDITLSLFVAAEILSKQKSADAEMKLAMATSRLNTMKSMYTSRVKVRMGMGSNPADQRGYPRIRVFQGNP